MHSELNARLAFHLTGAREAPGIEPLDGLRLRPALLARYRDLTALRYDYPLVFTPEGPRPLTAIVDEALKELTDERVRAQALRREREIRARIAGGWRGKLAALWNVEPKLAADGELADCDAALPAKFVTAAWAKAEETRARRFHEEAGRLVERLSAIIAADYVHSDDGRTAEALAKSLAARDDSFDTVALSRLLAKALPERRLDAARRRRISWALAVLKSREPQNLVFDSASAALHAIQEARPGLIDVAKAMAMARLEAAGEYAEAVHDPVFAEFGESAIEPGLHPACLVCVNARELQAPQNAWLADLLASGLPVKVLVQHDDILDWSSASNTPCFCAQARALAGMALGLSDVFVVQASASHLFPMAGAVADAMDYPGAALFHVFAAPYLVAAAAVESRAFPALRYDPRAAPGARLSLDGNPQPERDWPVHALEYEDAEHQRVREELDFTLMDFVAADDRYADYFARVPRAQSNGEVPSLPMVDADNRLHSVIVGDAVAREARRCLDAWRELQTRVKRAEAVVKPAESVVKPAEEVVKPAADVVPAKAGTPEAASASDAAYIETPRCTTCEECVKINPRLFVYDANKQAHIAEPKAGSYRELVEAAEACQVSIIHPGRPVDPDEPGLAELLERARPFL